MRVAVGSQNPVKVAAVEDLLGDRAQRVEAVDVDPGVPEQPVGVDQTLTGARNRARRALRTDGADVGVGIEGGVAALDGPHDLSLVMWAAVSDGTTTGTGRGPAIALPEAVAERVRDGEELGPVMDDVTGDHGVARGRGAAGVLTGGLIDRQTALQTAIAGAFGPLLTEHYD